jgi:hypothetical protein
MKISTTVPTRERGAFTIGHREQQATLADLPPAAQALLDGSSCQRGTKAREIHHPSPSSELELEPSRAGRWITCRPD